MADVSVARTQRDDGLTHQTDAPKKAIGSRFPELQRPILVLWIGLVLATLTFILIGTLRVGAGNRLGRPMPVRETWSRFLDYLTEQGASPGVVVAVSGAAGIALIAAAIALWLAFSLKDEQSEIPDELTGI